MVAKTGPLVNKILKKHIKLPTHHNCTFTQTDYLKLAVYSSIHHNYAEGSSNQINLEAELNRLTTGFSPSGKRCPTGESLLWHVKKFHPTMLYAMHDAITEEIIKLARKAGGINRKVNLAIDFTDLLYYGDKDDPMVKRKKQERGTSSAHRYATSNIVVAGQRYTLKTIAIDKKTPTYMAVQKLITHAKTLVNLDHVMLDRGFNGIKVTSVLNKMGCNYIMPAIKNSKVRHQIRINSIGKTVRFMIGNKSCNVFTYLAIIKGRDGEKTAFYTNSERTCVQLYSQRWGIETSYSKTKQDFLSKTTSKNPIIRLFYFLLAVSLYNLWQLANLNLCPAQGRNFTKYLLKAKDFGTILWFIIKIHEAGPPHSQHSPPSIPGSILAG